MVHNLIEAGATAMAFFFLGDGIWDDSRLSYLRPTEPQGVPDHRH